MKQKATNHADLTSRITEGGFWQYEAFIGFW